MAARKVAGVRVRLPPSACSTSRTASAIVDGESLIQDARGGSMKKLAIGCAVFVVLCVVGGAAGSYFVYHKVRSTISGFLQLGEVPTIERSVRNKTPYAPPASGEI